MAQSFVCEKEALGLTSKPHEGNEGLVLPTAKEVEGVRATGETAHRPQVTSDMQLVSAKAETRS